MLSGLALSWVKGAWLSHLDTRQRRCKPHCRPVAGIPGVGLDYGGVGGGVLGVDIGLFQVCASR